MLLFIELAHTRISFVFVFYLWSWQIDDETKSERFFAEFYDGWLWVCLSLLPFFCEAELGKITLVCMYPCGLVQFCPLKDVAIMVSRLNMPITFMVFNLNHLQLNHFYEFLFGVLTFKLSHYLIVFFTGAVF